VKSGLFRAPGITRIAPVEESLTPRGFQVALGALPAGRLTVTLVRTRERERASASWAQNVSTACVRFLSHDRNDLRVDQVGHLRVHSERAGS
jgi:hypothetical protein